MKTQLEKFMNIRSEYIKGPLICKFKNNIFLKKFNIFLNRLILYKHLSFGWLDLTSLLLYL